ncbi:MAG: discoidin domain-containing protein [Ruminococcaceae bacterium]|nr:discoidin domain-containing protein [Oscillospiraceae bacterium]
MKKVFLKRILPVVMCVLMVVPAFAFNVLAANLSATGIPGDKSIIGTERANWAPNGQGYHTSVWNGDRHSKYLNNGTYNHSYQWWEPSDPKRPNGAGVDPTKQYFGFSFDDGYYLLDEIIIYAHKRSHGVDPVLDANGNVVKDENGNIKYQRTESKGFNNVKYTVEALILGEWVQVGVGYQDDGVDYEGSVQKISITLTHPKAAEGEDINTNNIRVWCSEYGSYAKRYGDFANMQPTEHDWWLTPCVQEVELMGVTGYRPAFDVPLNAYLVTNAALSGMIGADSSLSMRYPGLAGDDDLGSNWRAKSTGAQNIWAEFDKAYAIDNVGLNVGGCAADEAGITLTYNIKLLTSGTLQDGTWQTVVTDGTATTQSTVADYVIHDLDEPITALAMMVEITSVKTAAGKNSRAVVTELWAEIADGGKCIFLADYMTSAKKASTATGNLACYGAAYASSNFSYAGISKINNIIDGNCGYADKAWIAETYIIDTYVGVTLKEAHDVTKVALYFNDVLGGENGKHVFKFDLQAKVGDKFVTIKEGATSYDAEKKSYIVSILFSEAVHTDDLRIVFKSDALTFPYLKEFEVFEGDFVYSSYIGYELPSSREEGGPDVTNVYGERTMAQRGKYFSKLSPIEYFSIALEHDVQIDWLG